MSLIKKIDDIVLEHGFNGKERVTMYLSTLTGAAIPVVVTRYGILNEAKVESLAWIYSYLGTLPLQLYTGLMGFAFAHSFIFSRKVKKK